MPRKRLGRVYWRNGRAWGDFRDFADVGGNQRPLVPEGERYATTDADVAAKLATAEVDRLTNRRRNKHLLGHQNTVEFLSRLVLRVEGVEMAQVRLERSLSSPDFTSTLQAAILAASRTESPAKHEVFAALIAARFRAEADSYDEVLAPAAVDVLPRLTAADLSYTGLLVLLYQQRTTFDERATPEEILEHLEGFVLARAWTFVQRIEPEMARWSLAHMDSMGLLTFSTLSRRSITKVPAFVCISEAPALTLSSPATLEEEVERLLTRSEVGRAVVRIWKAGLRSVQPAPLGLFLGGAVIRAEQREA